MRKIGAGWFEYGELSMSGPWIWNIESMAFDFVRLSLGGGKMWVSLDEDECFSAE